MEFLTKSEVFYRKKLLSAGETVEDNKNLDSIYPALFRKIKNKTIIKNQPETKAISKLKYEDYLELQNSDK